MQHKCIKTSEKAIVQEISLPPLPAAAATHAAADDP
jgi:hypothetical protein